MKKLTASIWNAQYAQGKWDHLLREEKRNAVIGKLCRKYHPAPSVLDVGCGFGNIVRYLAYQRYLGIDFSAVALEQTPPHPQAEFRCADAKEFHTEEKFDLIIFNELLYYTDALHLLDRYRFFLNPDGLFFISMWVHPKTILLWKELEKKYDCIEQIEVQDRENQWRIGVLQINDNNLNK